jgi:hypothetical protein
MRNQTQAPAAECAPFHGGTPLDFTANREYGGVPFHFANGRSGPLQPALRAIQLRSRGRVEVERNARETTAQKNRTFDSSVKMRRKSAVAIRWLC